MLCFIPLPMLCFSYRVVTKLVQLRTWKGQLAKVVLEGLFSKLSPPRFYHQFGYDQVIPDPGLARSTLYPDLTILSLCAASRF